MEEKLLPQYDFSSPLICQTQLRQPKKFQKYSLSKCSSGHEESGFNNTKNLFLSFLHSFQLSSFSYSNNFSIYFIDVPPDFFSVKILPNTRGSDNRSAFELHYHQTF